MVIAFLLILGVISIWTGIHFYKKLSKIQKWKKTNAIILKREAKHSPNKQGASHSCQYEVGIEYEYFFHDKKYVHDEYSLVTSMMTHESAQKKVAKIPDKIIIYVNPENPQEAYYHVNSMWFAFVVLGTGIACLLSLVWLLINA